MQKKVAFNASLLYIIRLMKFKDYWSPYFSRGLKTKHLVSTFIQKRELPTIEMKLINDVVRATVKFNFVYLRKNMAESKMEAEHYTRIIDGSSDEVYNTSTKVSSRIGLHLEREFNKEWNKTLVQLLNKPTKNKSMLNLGVFKKDGYGIFDIIEPSELLKRKLNVSGMKQKDLASLAGVDETTLYRHLKGTFEISRESAIKYAKVLGCDPVEILFNSLDIPVWGTTDTQEMRMLNKFSVYASEIISNESKTHYRIAHCPREIYRPDVKAINIDCPNSVYHNHIAFYYNSNEPIVLEDQMVVVGTKIKNFRDEDVRLRYFIGIYKKNKNGRTVDLHSIDPATINVEGIEPDEDFNSFDDVVGMVEQEKMVIEDIEPVFTAPVVALVSDNKIYDPIKTEIFKAYDKIYTNSRREDFDQAAQFNRLKLQAALMNKVADEVNDHYDNDDVFEKITSDRVKLFMKGDKKFQNIVSEAAYKPTPNYPAAKKEKRITLDKKIKQLNVELNTEEEKIVQAAVDQIYEDHIDPDITPEEAGQK